MSVVSSILSTRSPGWKVNVRLASLMDSIFAIAFGLGLRFVVDTVSHHDFKLTGTLVGLWEGVILLHFLKKMPKSSDPFIAFGVRLFIDFLFTESVARMVLVLIWTALGMVLADITPAIWDDVGLKRIWKHFRRDVYTMIQMIPIVAFFPPTRTVRFSPSRAPSVISEVPTGITPSAAPTGQTPTTAEAAPAQRRHTVVRRRLPGYFSMDNTDTETDAGSVISVGTFGGITGRTARRLSVYPGRMDLDSQSERSTPSQNDLDEGNLSDTSSNVTEREPYSALPDPESIPDMEVEEPLHIDVTAAPVKLEDGEVTPTNKQPYYMPPTPSDSAIRWPRESDEAPPVLPVSSVPEIPDFLEDANTEDWEKIQRADYTDENEKPPTPPAKDDLPAAYRVQAQPPPQSNTSPDDIQGWDKLESYPTNDDNNNDNNDDTNDMKEKDEQQPQASTSTAANRQSQPPPYDYDDNLDDMYASDPQTSAQEKTGFDDVDLLGEESGVPPETTQPQLIDDVFTESNRPLSDLNFGGSNPWSKGFAAQALEIEAEKQRQVAAELERVRQQNDEIERLREEENQAAEKKKSEEDKAERKRLKQERKRQEEEEAQRRKEEEEKLAQQKEAEKEAEKERLKEEKRKKREEERAERLKKEAEDEAARHKKREEDAEAARLAEEEAKKKKEAEEAKKKKEAEEAKKKREEEEEKERKRREEEEEKKRVEEAEAEKKRLEEEKLDADHKAEAERQERERVEQEEKLKQQKAEEAKARKADDLKQLQEELAREQAEAQDAAGEAGRRTPTQQDPQVEPTTDVQDEVPSGEQEQEQEPSPAEEQDPFPDNKTDITDASEMPSGVRDRLHRTILTRAQISELEGQIEDLSKQLETEDADEKARIDAEIKAMQKTIRKLRRKDERRATEVPPPTFVGPKFKLDTDEVASLETLNQRDAEAKIEEKIEAMLLKPEANSLSFQIKMPFGNPGKKMMPNVIAVIDMYCLYPYTNDDRSGARHKHINVPADRFRSWLSSFREAVTRAEAYEDDDGYNPYK